MKCGVTHRCCGGGLHQVTITAIIADTIKATMVAAAASKKAFSIATRLRIKGHLDQDFGFSHVEPVTAQLTGDFSRLACDWQPDSAMTAARAAATVRHFISRFL